MKLKYIWISIRCPFVIFNTQLNNGNLLGQLDEFKQYDRLIIFVFGIFIMVFAIIVMIIWFIFFYRGIVIGFYMICFSFFYWYRIIFIIIDVGHFKVFCWFSSQCTH